MSPYGGRLSETQGHPTGWARLKMIKDLLRFWLEIDQKNYLNRREWQNSSLGIEFDLLANAEVNALATANTCIEAVGLNAGLVAFLENTFYALLCSTCFLPGLGDTADCQPPDVIAKNIATTDITKVWGTFSPLDKDRSRVAFALSRLAELFVLFHEVCHISYGHLLHDEIRNEDGIATIFEYRPRSVRTNARLLQAMEFDVDEGAAAASLSTAIEIFKSSSLFSRLFGTATEAERIYYWVLSVAILFRVLDLFTNSPEFDLTGTHPPPGPRTDHVIYCGGEWVRTTFPAYFDIYDVESRRALSHISDVWRALTLPSVTHELDPRKRHEFVQSLRDDLLQFDGQCLDYLLRRRGELVKARFGST